MKEQNQQLWPINQLFILLSASLVVLTILKASSDLLVPFLVAIAISILLSPLFNYLETKRIPKFISLIFVTLLALIPIVALGGYIGGQVQDFANNYEVIQKEFDVWIQSVAAYMGKFGINVTSEDMNTVLGSTYFTEMIQGLAAKAKHQFSNIFLIFFVVAFILMETTSIHDKLLKIINDRGGNEKDVKMMLEKIQAYFLIKVKTSLMTGVWILAVLWFYDIPYPLIWATLAFFLNFIPVIGSIIAAIPAVVMGLIDQSIMTAVWVALWYVTVNMVVGNILEPRIMGRGLGLSPLVIFLSMTFWGWMFGPAGMILSVPLTMMMQFLFVQYEETKWVALMLSDYKKEKFL